MTTNSNPDMTEPSRRGRRLLLRTTSLILAGGLVLGGCATSTTASSSSSLTGSSVAATPESTTGGTTVAAAAQEGTSSSARTTAETIANTTAAVESFLATLSDEQVEQVSYDYDDETKTTSWSNFPVTFVDRAGLNVADLSEEQQVAAMQVLEALLSDDGYETVANIIGGDQYLLENSSSTEASLGQYYIAFFGDAATGVYEVQFGGHHLGINASLDAAAETVTFAPTHLGTQPEVYTNADGTQVETFGTIYTTAFAFYDSLTDEQKAALYQGEDVQAMVCAPGSTCTFPTGTGLAGSELTDEQKQLLLDVIANWVGLADEQTTADALAKIEATLDDTYINWSGATVYDMSQGEGIYFQISGPDAYIEFASQQGSAGADVDGVVTSGWGHVHTIFRDPSNDYAGSVEQQEATGGMAGGAPTGAGPSGDGGAPPTNG